MESCKLLSVLYSASNVFLIINFPVFSFHLQTQEVAIKKQIQTILPHYLKQEITRLNNKCRNLDILRLKLWFKNKKLPPPLQKKLYHCLWHHPVTLLFFFYFSLLLICKHISCFFSMGRVFKKTQIAKEYWQER